MNTLDVASETIKNNPDIDLLTFSKYKQQPLIQEKIELSKIDNEFISAALDIRNRLRLPFWDSLMLSFFDKKNVSKKLLSNALTHNKNIEKITTRNIEDIRNYIIKNPQESLSLNSEILLKDNTVKHFFLLDFHIYPSDNNLKITTDILQILGLHGYILDSGESYHFVSDSFFELESLINLLAKSLLFSPIVDRAWIAHQILERSCSLRVGIKHGIMPNVITKII